MGQKLEKCFIGDDKESEGSIVSVRETTSMMSFKATTAAGAVTANMKCSLGDRATEHVDHSTTEVLHVFCGTWNVGNEVPPDDLSEWLGNGSMKMTTTNSERTDTSSSTSSSSHDIYAIGVQECEYMPRDGNTTCEEDWFTSLASYLGSDYVALSQFTISPITNDDSCDDFYEAMAAGLTSPGEIRMSVFVKQCHRKKISCVERSLKTCGRVNGVSGNKGGLSVSFKYGDTSLCFINCHLNAHREKWERRNLDLLNINSGLTNGLPELDAINQMDYVFFMGDLNYRIELSMDEVLQSVDAEDWDTLLKDDQLKAQQREGNALHNFKEGFITWPPTFKIKKGKVLEYNTKEREPSYCDRVLYKALPGRVCTVKRYDAVRSITTSDHKPVLAEFDISTTTHVVAALAHSGIREIVITQLRGDSIGNVSFFSAADQITDTYAVAYFMSRDTKTLGHTNIASSGSSRSPEWSDSLRICVPDMCPAVFDTLLLFIAVRAKCACDVNLLRLGEGVISCKGFVIGDTPKSFEIDLTQHGLPAGRLFGQIAVF